MILAQDSASSEFKQFLRILDTAVLCNMPRLLACCEHHIAEPSHRDWIRLHALEEHLPSKSMLRIVAALQKACRQSKRGYGIELPDAHEHWRMAQGHMYVK